MLFCPESAATFAAWKRALGQGQVEKTDRVVLFNTQSPLKAGMPATTQRLDIGKPIDYQALAGEA